MRGRFIFVVLLASCASTSARMPACEAEESRPFSVLAGRRGEVSIERTVMADCAARERLVWREFILPIEEAGWGAGGLMFWQGKIALDLHRKVNGVPAECKTRLYRFKGKKLEFVRESTCGP